MQKDLKIGMLAGAAIVLLGWILFALFSDTPQQRRLKQFETEPINPAPQTEQSIPAPLESLEPTSPAMPSTQQNTPPLDDQPQIHTVQTGETLGSIAAKYYGNFSQWQKILDANQDILQKPEQLKPGMRLKIPPK
ncbi:MAG: LysM peptidoglycan-binding domain-containing protein [Sedimentisphaerales bacterium]|nr:LysM peptidoglycan-binding domain-containing protein [Sedimentisphaerales bacterium]